MSGIVRDGIDEYIDELVHRGDESLRALEREGLKGGLPIVGAAEGALLHILARAVRAKRILELGTAIGYSGTWLARALAKGGELVTVEWDPERAKVARANFAKTDVGDRVRVEAGSALDVLPKLPDGSFDVVFNDIDKKFYVDVLPHCIAKLRVGGLLLTDNVLWGGDVTRKRRDREAAAIHSYNELLSRDPRMLAVIVPLRDGVSIAMKTTD